MTITPAARAAASIFATFGSDAMQRGRRCWLQVCALKSSINSAVVLLSAVTALSTGAGGTFTDAHSSMMVCALTVCVVISVAIAAAATMLRNGWRIIGDIGRLAGTDGGISAVGTWRSILHQCARRAKRWRYAHRLLVISPRRLH